MSTGLLLTHIAFQMISPEATHRSYEAGSGKENGHRHQSTLKTFFYIYIKITAALTGSGGAAMCQVWLQNAEQVLLGGALREPCIKIHY